MVEIAGDRQTQFGLLEVDRHLGSQVHSCRGRALGPMGDNRRCVFRSCSLAFSRIHVLSRHPDLLSLQDCMEQQSSSGEPTGEAGSRWHGSGRIRCDADMQTL